MGGGILYHVIRWNVLFAANLQEELGIVAGQSQVMSVHKAYASCQFCRAWPFSSV